MDDSLEYVIQFYDTSGSQSIVNGNGIKKTYFPGGKVQSVIEYKFFDRKLLAFPNPQFIVEYLDPLMIYGRPNLTKVRVLLCRHYRL